MLFDCLSRSHSRGVRGAGLLEMHFSDKVTISGEAQKQGYNRGLKRVYVTTTSEDDCLVCFFR